MQTFEYMADASARLILKGAVDRKSCDHCFLNRKTCSLVRGVENEVGKCTICADKNRDCTITPTDHLYNIADCVGLHQCRAKVVQTKKSNIKKDNSKKLDISLILDMDSARDVALANVLSSLPSLLALNERVLSFLANDCGLLPNGYEDRDSVPSASGNAGSGSQHRHSYSSSHSPSMRAKRSFDEDMMMEDSQPFTPLARNPESSPPHKHRISVLIDTHHNLGHAHHDQSASPSHSGHDRIPSPIPLSPQHPAHNYSSQRSNGNISPNPNSTNNYHGRYGSISGASNLSPLSPSSNANWSQQQQQQPQHPQQHPYQPIQQQSTVPNSTANSPVSLRVAPVPAHHQRRHSDSIIFQQTPGQPQQSPQQQQMEQQQQQQQYQSHPYQTQPQQQQVYMQDLQQKFHAQTLAYHSPQTSTMPSYDGSTSPLPPSPIDLNNTVGDFSLNQQGQNIYRTSSTQGHHSQQQQQFGLFEETSHPQGRIHASTSMSPAMTAVGIDELSMAASLAAAESAANDPYAPLTPTSAMASGDGTAGEVVPSVIEITNVEGKLEGFYFPMPKVELLPGFTNDDLFQFDDETGFMNINNQFMEYTEDDFDAIREQLSLPFAENGMPTTTSASTTGVTATEISSSASRKSMDGTTLTSNMTASSQGAAGVSAAVLEDQLMQARLGEGYFDQDSMDSQPTLTQAVPMPMSSRRTSSGYDQHSNNNSSSLSTSPSFGMYSYRPQQHQQQPHQG